MVPKRSPRGGGLRAALTAATSRRVAFLRGINVGGSGLLKMEDLRNLAGDVGLKGAVTVGASGNLIYESTSTAKADETRLAKTLVKRMGKGVVVVRDRAEMAALTRTNRFANADPKIPDKWRFVAFLAGPTAKPLPRVTPHGPIQIVGRTPREVFYTMAAPSSAAINMAHVLERALGIPTTVRNWNVVRDIAARLNATR